MNSSVNPGRSSEVPTRDIYNYCLLHRPGKPAASTDTSKSGLSPREQLERQAEIHSCTEDEARLSCPYSAGTLRYESEMEGTLRFLPPLEMRPFSIAPKPVESREATPNSTVSLTSQRHPEKLPEVTGTSRGNPAFPAATRERP